MQSEMQVTFAMDDALFALPVTTVQEILAARPAAPLPRAPGHLLGLIDVRGRSVAVIDLRRLLGAPPRGDDEDTRIIVLWFRREGTEHTLALRVDRVIEVTLLDGEGTAEPLLERDLLHWNEGMIAGVGRREGAFVTVLRLEGVFSPEVIAAAGAADAA